MKTYKLKIENQIYDYIVYENGDFESTYPLLNFDISRQVDLQIKKNNIKVNQMICLTPEC